MLKYLNVSLICLLFILPAIGQQKKPWTEWQKKDAEKILNESPWGQTQNNADDGQFSKTGADLYGNGRTPAPREESTMRNKDVSMRLRVRFFTAKPVREAFARMIVLQQNTTDDQKLKAFAGKLQGWVDADLGDIIVMSLAIDSDDPRMSMPVEQVLHTTTSELLKNVCYLERKDGKRIFITQYEPPTADQTGAKFVFPRTLNGEPFITPDGDFIRFVVELGGKATVDRRFKISDMMYNGKLEY